MNNQFAKLRVFACFLLGAASGAQAGAILVPPSLNPGDVYRIVFVTSTERAVTSNIALLNAFVTAAANSDAGLASISTTWTALASTTSTTALNNTSLTGDTTTPIFNTNGSLVAVGGVTPGTGLYGGNTTAHSSAILSEAGASLDDVVWTGTDAFGAALAVLEAADFALAGLAGEVDLRWTASGPVFSQIDLGGGSLAVSHHFYGISGPLVVPNAIPEPNTIVLTSVGSAALLLVMRFRRQQS